jgi:hypothetical protein
MIKILDLELRALENPILNLLVTILFFMINLPTDLLAKIN